MTRELDTKVTRCHDCPFYSLDGHTMFCGHPVWKGYDGFIINQSNHYGIPDKCPLRLMPITTIKTVHL